MAAAPLRSAGHEVLIATIPIDWEQVIDFGPQVVIIALYRKEHAQNGPIQNFETDVLGVKALLEAEEYPAVQVLPILLVGQGVQEGDVPTSLHYDLFLSFPRDVKLYVPKVEELATTVKTRRKLSGYICPCCGSRLVFLTLPAKDLFCPRCHTTVVLTNQRHILYSPRSEGESIKGTIDQITPPTSGRGER